MGGYVRQDVPAPVLCTYLFHAPRYPRRAALPYVLGGRQTTRAVGHARARVLCAAARPLSLARELSNCLLSPPPPRQPRRRRGGMPGGSPRPVPLQRAAVGVVASGCPRPRPLPPRPRPATASAAFFSFSTAVKEAWFTLQPGRSQKWSPPVRCSPSRCRPVNRSSGHWLLSASHFAARTRLPPAPAFLPYLAEAFVRRPCATASHQSAGEAICAAPANEL